MYAFDPLGGDETILPGGRLRLLLLNAIQPISQHCL